MQLLPTMAAAAAKLASALGAFEQQHQPPLQVVRITSYSGLQRLLAVVGLGKGEQYLAVDRNELINCNTAAALEQFVLQMFKLNPGDAKILAVTANVTRCPTLEE